VKALRTVLFALGVIVAMPAGASAAPADAVYAAIAKTVAAIDAGDTKTLNRLVSPHATVVDDMTPFVFDGFGAWGAAFDKYTAANKMTDPLITIKKSPFIDVIGDFAYAPIPTTFSYKTGGKPMKETGVLVFRLARRAGNWIVLSMAWGQTG
jgi:ketosteroid isomerase-like protein